MDKHLNIEFEKITISEQRFIHEARQIIISGGASCVVIKNGGITHQADGRGVSPLMKLYRETSNELYGAWVFDKVIGKAAAMILVLGGAKYVYGEIMSESARQYLNNYGIHTGFGACVDYIEARDKADMCPIEKSVVDIDDPNAGLEAITETISTLMRKAG